MKKLLYILFNITIFYVNSTLRPEKGAEAELFNNNGIEQPLDPNLAALAGIYPLSWTQMEKRITVQEIENKIIEKNADWTWQIEKWHFEWERIKESIARKKSETKAKKNNGAKKAYFTKFIGRAKMDRLVLLATDLLDASTNSVFTDSTDVIEILVTTTNKEKDVAGINENFCEKLSNENEVSGNYKAVLIPLCFSRRVESFHFISEENELQNIIKRLNELVTKPHDFHVLTENDILVNALVTFSYPKLRHIFEKYEQIYGNKIEQKVTDIYFDEFKHLKVSRLKSAFKGNFRVEQHFWQTAEKWSENDALKDVTRILLSRAPIDLADIDDEFSSLHGIGSTAQNSISDSLDRIIKSEIAKQSDKKQSGAVNDEMPSSTEVNGKPSQKIETLKAFKQIVQWAKQLDEQRFRFIFERNDA
uniref:Uncharacterized protein n=1 Tax=Globodera rostochiensis TaxID=31243 RepID=A0A914I396_GLORO